MKLLIVEDDPVSMKILKINLDKLGREYVAASNGIEALELFKEYRFQIIISDWMMPLMDGLELCKAVRSLEHERKTYFIFLTVLEGEDNVLASVVGGANDYIAKPLKRDVLKEKLDAAFLFIEVNN